MNTISLLDNAWRDLEYGARLLRLNPLNSLFVWIAGTDLVTIRIDLHPRGGPTAPL